MQIEEISIPFEWGNIAGKWWGPKNIRPILLLHGWQDNAGTFDTLISLLPLELSYLAIDLPGHGQSDHLPQGLCYNYIDYVYLINLIRVHFKWERISIMAHSMGSIVGYIYSGIFPDNVDLLIGLDTLKPLVRHAAINVDFMSMRGIHLIIADQRNRDRTKEPPSYTYDELIERMVDGTRGSVTHNSARYLVERGTKRSSLHANKYYFSRDSRIKFINEAYFDQAICLQLGKRIQCPHLFIKSSDSDFSEKYRNITETINLLRKTNRNFEVKHVLGTHHVHLNDPDKVAPIISVFLRKYRMEAFSATAENGHLLKNKL